MTASLATTVDKDGFEMVPRPLYIDVVLQVLLQVSTSQSQHIETSEGSRIPSQRSNEDFSLGSIQSVRCLT